ncbi:MAG: UDP-N-acetylglucosamine 2-epimerase (non-hydrolyzing) [Micrococcaceae bacterium]
MKKICLIYGTRPEAIKFAPLIEELKNNSDIEFTVVNTGQHKSMVDQVHEFFGITPDINLDIFYPGQSIADIFSRTVKKLQQYFFSSSKFSAVVVQGDTTTSISAGLTAFYNKIPVVHMEAGLRSNNLWSPFPEEANRKMLSHITSLHLAPTKESKKNLLKENIDDKAITITGNTVIDAARTVSERSNVKIPFQDKLKGKKLILVTTHRRENLGKNLKNIVSALKILAEKHEDVIFVIPMHKNPEVREPYNKSLKNLNNVILCEPVDYITFISLIKQAKLILSDSGGVQEEAPYFNVPVLVLRENTERPEAVEMGTAKLIGSDTNKIIKYVDKLLIDNKAYENMSSAVNPYGDGYAAKKTVAAIRDMLN